MDLPEILWAEANDGADPEPDLDEPVDFDDHSDCEQCTGYPSFPTDEDYEELDRMLAIDEQEPVEAIMDTPRFWDAGRD